MDETQAMATRPTQIRTELCHHYFIDHDDFAHLDVEIEKAFHELEAEGYELVDIKLTAVPVGYGEGEVGGALRPRHRSEAKGRIAMQMVADKPSLHHRMEHDASRPLSELQLRAVALLVEGELTTQAIADTLRVSRVTLWNWRQLSAFRSEYQRQLAAAEQQAADFAVSRRVNRVAALDALHAKLLQAVADRAALYADEPYLPARTGLFVKDVKSIGSGAWAYAETVWTLDKATIDAILSLQKQAATELGQWQEKVDVRGRVEVTEPVRVIRFEAQAPRADLEAIDAEYRAASPPVCNAAGEHEFAPLHELAGWPRHLAHLDPEHAPAMRRAIDEAGLDPASVLTSEQYRHVYGTEE